MVPGNLIYGPGKVIHPSSSGLSLCVLFPVTFLCPTLFMYVLCRYTFGGCHNYFSSVAVSALHHKLYFWWKFARRVLSTSVGNKRPFFPCPLPACLCEKHEIFFAEFAKFSHSYEMPLSLLSPLNY